MDERIMRVEDRDIGEYVVDRFTAEGVDVRTSHKATRFRIEAEGTKILVCDHAGEEVEIAFDTALVAVGRAARTADYGLDQLGIQLTERKTIDTDEYLQTQIPTIYACGDVVGPYQFTHAAAHQAWHATVNALFGAFKRFKVDYSVLPHCTFTDPEVARVGFSEQDAQQAGRDYEVTYYDLGELDRAITEGEDKGAHGTGQGPDHRRGHRRRPRRRSHRRVRLGDEAQAGAEQDPRHGTSISDAGRGQQVRRGRVEACPCAGDSATAARALPRMAAWIIAASSNQESGDARWQVAPVGRPY